MFSFYREKYLYHSILSFYKIILSKRVDYTLHGITSYPLKLCTINVFFKKKTLLKLHVLTDFGPESKLYIKCTI